MSECDGLDRFTAATVMLFPATAVAVSLQNETATHPAISPLINHHHHLSITPHLILSYPISLGLSHGGIVVFRGILLLLVVSSNTSCHNIPTDADVQKLQHSSRRIASRVETSRCKFCSLSLSLMSHTPSRIPTHTLTLPVSQSLSRSSLSLVAAVSFEFVAPLCPM